MAKVKMPKAKKTREEKVRSAYRLQNFKLDTAQVAQRKDREEFGYLSSSYVKQDLLKTLLYTLIIVGLLLFAKLKLG